MVRSLFGFSFSGPLLASRNALFLHLKDDAAKKEHISCLEQKALEASRQSPFR
jgi:hypothetical protein